MLSLRCEVNEQLYFRNGSQLKHVRSHATAGSRTKYQKQPSKSRAKYKKTQDTLNWQRDHKSVELGICACHSGKIQYFDIGSQKARIQILISGPGSNSLSTWLVQRSHVGQGDNVAARVGTNGNFRSSV